MQGPGKVREGEVVSQGIDLRDLRSRLDSTNFLCNPAQKWLYIKKKKKIKNCPVHQFPCVKLGYWHCTA